MTNLNAQQALRALTEGNRRFAAGSPRHPRQGQRRRRELLAGQSPLAAILGCSDSRVPPELIFDQGLGDLFVVRVAGNTAADTATLGSLEYAAVHLRTRLIVVLGHSSCGALQAALAVSCRQEGHTADALVDAPAPAALLGSLQDAVDDARRSDGDLLEAAIRANVGRTVARLRRTEPFRRLSRRAGLMVVGAHYDLASGRLTWLEEIAQSVEQD